jgi:hypothetical protein
MIDAPHTIAHDFVARFALYMTAFIVIFDPSFDVLGGRVLTMRNQHHKHLSPNLDHIILCHAVSATIGQEELGSGPTHCFTGKAPAHDALFSS